MSGFSDSSLSQKLSELNATAQCIQGVSLWLLHHRKHYQTYVKVWYRELGKMAKDQKLPMMYLANDLVQNSRKKYPEVAKEFGQVMKAVFVHLAALEFDAKTQKSIHRLVNIWKERQSFEKKVLSEIDEAWEGRCGKVDVESEPVNKKLKASPKTSADQTNGKTVDLEESVQNIFKVLQDLKATSDSDSLDDSLSCLPENVPEEELSEEEINSKLELISSIESQLIEQRKVIAEEIETRKNLEKLMSQFILAQRKLVDKKKERLKLCDAKLQSVEEAKSHFEAQLLNAALVEDELEAIPMPDQNTEAVADNKDDLEGIPMPEDS